VTTVRLRRNGPLVIDDEDVTVVDWNGRAYPITRRPVALCRCGASSRKPFCDGTHGRIGFAGDESPPPEATPPGGTGIA
jgi:CDGSH-type Zn-finger protein